SAAFADPINGGTLEFYGSGGFIIIDSLVVNKLRINLSSPASIMTLAANLKTNGLFEVNVGTFIVNNAVHTSRVLKSYAPVLVESQGKIKVSSASGLTRHKWYFYSDLINNGGELKFTNRAAPADLALAYSYYSVTENRDIID